MEQLRIHICILFCAFSLFAFGQPDLSQPTYIAPDFFGPNAQPIPDMSDGTTSKSLRIELAGDYYAGFRGDRTADIFAKLIIPLYTERVNLSVWMPIVEWYTNTEESVRGAYPAATVPASEHEFGDVYITTDMHILKQKRICPDLTLRAGIKTASGGGCYAARYFDAPGYFFEVSVAKSVFFKGNFFHELRFAGSGGFLCWQTDTGRQNDAVMYGLQVKLRTKYFTLSETWGGYSGWERCGDLPMSLKTNLNFHCGDLEPFFAYQYGLRDYPYHQIRIGLAYNIDILNGIKTNK